MSSDDEMVDVGTPVRKGRDTPSSEASNSSRDQEDQHPKTRPVSNQPLDDFHIRQSEDDAHIRQNGNGSISLAKTAPNGSLSETPEKDGSVDRTRKSESAPTLSPSKPPLVRGVKFEKDVARLQEVLADVSPEVAQRVLHENWRSFIFKNYDASHISFILRAILKNANTDVLDRVVKEGGLFKGDILEAAVSNPVVVNLVISDPDNYPRLISYMAAEDIMAAMVQEDVDRLVLARLRTLETQQLVDMLAASGRLGFGDTDEMEREVITPRYEEPLPNNVNDNAVVAIQAIISGGQTQQSAAPPPPAAGEPAEMRCRKCNRGPFWHKSGFNYHVSKGNCDKPAPATGWKWVCDFCYQGFTTKQGREYHNLKHVCENCDIEPATLPTGGLTLSLGAPQPQPGEPGARPLMVAARPQSARASSCSSVPQAPPPLASPTVGQSVSLYSSPAPTTSIQRPPMRTPASIPGSPGKRPSTTPPTTASASTPVARKPQVGDSDIRQSPSELAPERKAALDKEIADEDAKYEFQKQEAMKLPPGEDREHRLTQLKNGNASKKSGIRKRYGVTLRMRDKDKAAMGLRKSSSTPSKLRESLSANPEISMLPPPPANGFSAINTIIPASANFSPMNGQHPISKGTDSQVNGQLPTRSYGSPYGNGAALPSNGHPPPYPPPNMSPYTQPGQSPYGPPPTQSPAGTYVSQYGPSPNNLKRQRSVDSTGDEGAARPSPGPSAAGYQTPYATVKSPTQLSTSESESKEAPSQISTTKMSKYITEPQAKWQAMRPSQSASNSPAGSAPASPTAEKDGGSDVAMNDAPTDASTPTSKTDVIPTTETPAAAMPQRKEKDVDMEKGKQNIVIALDDSDDSDGGSIINENA